jgi:PAS domain S-box-containing protein
MERLKQEENERNQKMLKEIENAAAELQKEKALLDALLDNVPECIYFKDKQSRFLRFSKSMLTLFGLNKPEELLGKSDFDFFTEEHSKPAFDDEQKIIRTGKAIIDLEEKDNGDGCVNWVNTTNVAETARRNNRHVGIKKHLIKNWKPRWLKTA